MRVKTNVSMNKIETRPDVKEMPNMARLASDISIILWRSVIKKLNSLFHFLNMDMFGSMADSQTAELPRSLGVIP